jgi:hypothetical protein
VKTISERKSQLLPNKCKVVMTMIGMIQRRKAALRKSSHLHQLNRPQLPIRRIIKRKTRTSMMCSQFQHLPRRVKRKEVMILTPKKIFFLQRFPLNLQHLHRHLQPLLQLMCQQPSPRKPKVKKAKEKTMKIVTKNSLRALLLLRPNLRKLLLKTAMKKIIKKVLKRTWKLQQQAQLHQLKRVKMLNKMMPMKSQLNLLLNQRKLLQERKEVSVETMTTKMKLINQKTKATMKKMPTSK